MASSKSAMQRIQLGPREARRDQQERDVASFIV